MTSDSGFWTTTRRSSSAAGKSSRLRRPKYSRNSAGGAVGHRPAHHLGAPDLLDQSALDQRLHHAIHAHAAHLLDLGARDRLAIGDDGERLQRRLGEARRAEFVADQRLEPGGVFRLGDELPRARHAGEPIAALGRLVVLRQLFERRRSVRFPSLS